MSKRIYITLCLFLIFFFWTTLSVSCNEIVSLSPTITITQLPSAEVTTTVYQVIPTATIPLVLPTNTSESTNSLFHLPQNPNEIRDLVPSAMKCQFPCFLGIFPGKTDYKTTIDEITQVATSYSGEVKSKDGKFGYNFKIYYSQNKLDLSADVKTLDQNKVLELTLYPTISLADFFSVSKVLNYYGDPDNIYVFTLSEPYGDSVLPFDLFLDYSTKGYLLWYRNPNTVIENNRLKLCYLPENAPTIYLWSPENKKSFYDIAPIGKPESMDAKLIQDVIIFPDSDRIFDTLANPDGFCVQSDFQNWKDITEYIP